MANLSHTAENALLDPTQTRTVKQIADNHYTVCPIRYIREALKH